MVDGSMSGGVDPVLEETQILNVQKFCESLAGDCQIFSRAHGDEKRKNNEGTHACINRSALLIINFLNKFDR